MLVPLSWLRQYAALPEGTETAEVARRLTGIGLEIEGVEPVGHDISGVVVARVLEIEELTEFKKPVRFCKVTTGGAGGAGGAGGEREVICGAFNFAVGDLVALALPGAVLPGGFEIGARKTYGRISDGMICSARELALGDDHTGIMVLPPDAQLGADFVSYAGLRDVVLDINVTPDKGHAMSVRGAARELASAFGVAFTDPADAGLPFGAGEAVVVGAESAQVWPASIGDPTACDRFVLREIRGFDPLAPTPLWMRVRLARCGMRCVSLAVDVTNYLMIELGQPLHAFDRSALHGPIVVRRAKAGERLEALDHVVRDLDPEDILITDSSGPISMAGTMGGLATEVSETSHDLVIEAAHFSAPGTARMSRRHRLFSEASARFERGVDYELPPRASARAVTLLAALGGGTVVDGYTLASAPILPVTVTIPADHPDRVAGVSYGADTVIRRLEEVGCLVAVAGDGKVTLTVTPPSWRPDLKDPNDLAEEVIRVEGYDKIGIGMPRAVAGRGRTAAQRLRTAVGRALAGYGFVEVLSSPFASAEDLDRLLLDAGDARRHAVRLANPVRDEEPLLRTTLLPGLLRVLNRNAGRGFADLALFETGLVFRARPGGSGVAPVLPVDHRPSEAELGRIAAALPDQPRRVAAVLTGDRDPAGWWGGGRPADYRDAIQAARVVLEAAGPRYSVRADKHAPFHPGRCAALYVLGADGEQVLAGHAGELHPRVIAAFGLAPRTSAMELGLTIVEQAAAGQPVTEAPQVSGYPVATQDVALVVDDTVTAAEVEAALLAGAVEAAAGTGSGVLLEDVRLFDVYTGEQAGAGRKSLAYTLRFRSQDRTLTAEEVTAARDAAVAEAARLTGAVLRGGPA